MSSSRRVLNTMRNKKKKIFSVVKDPVQEGPKAESETQIVEKVEDEKIEATVPKSEGIRNFEDLLGLFQKTMKYTKSKFRSRKKNWGSSPDIEDPVEEFEPKFD